MINKNTTLFSELQFSNIRDNSGIYARVEFSNGYGASVVKSTYSYGGKCGLYELAVMKNGRLAYFTKITRDVLGNLREADVSKYLNEISLLKKQKPEVIKMKTFVRKIR